MNLPVKDLKELISIDPPNGFDLWNALVFMLKNQINMVNLKAMIINYNEEEKIIQSVADKFAIQINLYLENNLVKKFGSVDDPKRCLLLKKDNKDYKVLESVNEIKRKLDPKTTSKLTKYSNVKNMKCSNCKERTSVFQFILTNLHICYDCLRTYHHHREFSKTNLYLKRNCANQNCNGLCYYLYKDLCNSCFHYFKRNSTHRPSAICEGKIPCSTELCFRSTSNPNGQCYKCNHITGLLLVKRMCIYCEHEELFSPVNASKGPPIYDDWLCSNCKKTSIRVYDSEDSRCECGNRLVKITNKKREDFSKSFCSVCEFINLIKIKFKDEFNDEENTFQEIFNKFTEDNTLDDKLSKYYEILSTVGHYFDDKDCNKFNYLYLSADFDENCSFEDFLYCVIYIGFGNEDRSQQHLPLAVQCLTESKSFYNSIKKSLDRNNLIVYEYEVNEARPISTWVEKCGISVQKSIGNQDNFNIANGYGKTKFEHKKLVDFFGLISLYKAYLDIKNGSGKTFLSNDFSNLKNL